MSGNSYGYYYPTNSQNYPLEPSHAAFWTKVEPPPPPPPPPPQPQNYGESYNRSSMTYSTPMNHISHSMSRPPPNYYHQSNGRHYQNRRYNGNGQQNWQQRNMYKRPRTQDSLSDNGESKSKSSKKKKKPLSQNIPNKRDWTEEEAERALAVEKEYNKRFKNHSLIIKFPDLELNRDIVTTFHNAIENVHFQQPSTPRFCFVTLQENCDADQVIKDLNKVKFGDGFLTAEYKKDREDDQNLGPGDIDPCTLYVGNLAQEITKEDVVKAYPKGRRIDIGYAKKMKYTRYAFVSFKNVDDSIEAFKKTHSTQMHSKSLIVRFRRLHGTVGMPGEQKPQQSPQKNKPEQNNTIETNNSEETKQRTNSNSSRLSTRNSEEVDLSVVKQEREDSDDEDYESPFIAGSIDIAMAQHKAIKQEVKTERYSDEEDMIDRGRLNEEDDDDYLDRRPRREVKEEPDKLGDSSDDDLPEHDVNFSNLFNQTHQQAHDKLNLAFLLKDDF